jgi:ATP-dependent DNA helicase RecQ
MGIEMGRDHESAIQDRIRKTIQAKITEGGRLAKMTASQQELFTRLCLLRRQIALAEGVPAFQILGNRSLLGVCESLPLTAEDLANIEGIGRRRVAAYGEDILRVVRAMVVN